MVVRKKASVLPQRRRTAGTGSGGAVPYLRAADLFRDLSDDEVEEIHRYFPMRECQRGTVFFRAGEPDERLFILKRGRVVLYRLTQEGQRLIIGTVRPGTIFGEMSLAGLGMRDCFAEAQDDALVCVATKKDMERLLTTLPAIGTRLLEVFGRRVLALEEQLELIAYNSVRQRLVAFLVRWARPEGGAFALRGYSHHDLAAAVGAARQTVTLELKRLEESGSIRVRRRSIEIGDMSSLKRQAA
ncbi:MAG: Crp/Fnr family transcriptional regulator [Chloroflexi bacterium]|nr:Crp/Fnr family transcriptional regulator [Chloroflexota bacterium]